MRLCCAAFVCLLCMGSARGLGLSVGVHNYESYPERLISIFFRVGSVSFPRTQPYGLAMTMAAAAEAAEATPAACGMCCRDGLLTM